MAAVLATQRFSVAVSLRENYKMGTGTTTRDGERVLYYYAEKTPETGIRIQALNGNSVPSGEVTPVPEAEFLEKYKPEPLLYYNQVKPRMDAMQQELARGEKHLEAGRLERAEESFQRALGYDAENLRAIFGLGNAYLSGGKLDEAREIFDKIMGIDLAFGPENKFLFNEFGIRMRKMGLLDLARAYYEKALGVSENDENLQFNLGRVLYELKDYPAAAQAAERCLAINPGFLIAAKLAKAARKSAAAAAEKS
ncbi:tetratricopeptide repeat protein [Desulfovibrio aerotolerans]|uniref:Tetratricopeptide repeat protein n=1 Tax=Solidesulfovibrio aerotolerans TaxID=295255 RepID=A0A7C9N3N2_9BACT|nr:tetratricopeptide repeat protein [Solidesulfovibrio aerotolerans]MYL84711.1 tetratricopeptide repeat protein [Solidesulfovibrio aerotolerans]